MKYREMVEKLKSPEYHIDRVQADLMHAAQGLVTESAELMDALKKVIFYGKEIDYVNLKEEAGDIRFYLELLYIALGTTDEEEKRRNMAKLMARYGDRFTTDAAINRDLGTERQVLLNPRIESRGY